MTQTILITGATDGLGRATAQALADKGHALIVHGRNADKLASTAKALEKSAASVTTVQADLSDLKQVAAMADQILASQDHIDVVINNAGIFKTAHPRTASGQDIRFVVNTLAPALLSTRLLPVLGDKGRLVHLSSAAQAPVDLAALAGDTELGAMEAYAQSKLALTIWSQSFAAAHWGGPVSVAVNPGSLLATKMVREGFGTSGNNIDIGVNILTRAALSAEFADASGQYYDNDSQRFARPHPEAADSRKSALVVAEIERLIAAFV